MTGRHDVFGGSDGNSSWPEKVQTDPVTPPGGSGRTKAKCQSVECCKPERGNRRGLTPGSPIFLDTLKIIQAPISHRGKYPKFRFSREMRNCFSKP